MRLGTTSSQRLIRLQHLLTLQLPENMGHADIGKRHVVPTGRTCVVTIETAQIGIEPIRRSCTRLDSQIRWDYPEPGLRIALGHCYLHRVTNLIGGKKQIDPDLFFAETNIGEPVVAHVIGAMAIQTVIDEQLCTTLQRFLIVQVDWRLVQMNIPASGVRVNRHRQKNGRQ